MIKAKRFTYNFCTLTTGRCFLFFCLMITAVTIIAGCNSPFVQKKPGYFKIDFPEKKYAVFNQPGYPYTFEYPVYAGIVKDSTFFDEAAENPWWINIDFKQFDAKIYISYKQIGKQSFAKLLNDAFKLTGKHDVKANSIDDSAFTTQNNINGVYFKVGGDVASANQFFLTDTSKHFLRGSLYFNAPPNADSLEGVNSFIAADLRHLINTFKWK